jgi:predicted dienelactone hydrolase
VCRPQLEFPVTEADRTTALADPEIAALVAHAHDDHSVATAKAVFAMAPALVQAIDPDSLRILNKPVSIVTGSADAVAPPDSNANIAAGSIPGAQLTIVPDAGHYAFLALCTPAGVAALPMCGLAGAQEEAHRAAIEQARTLLARYLADPRN